MKKLISYILILVALSCLSFKVSAQENQNFLYLGAGLDKDFLHFFNGGLEFEYRYNSDKTSFLVVPEITFSPVKYFEAGLEYRFSTQAEDKYKTKTDSSWTETSYENRIGLSITGKLPISIFKAEVRLKYCTYNDDCSAADADSSMNHDQYLRLRFKGSVSIKPLNLTPYVSYEFFRHLNRSVVDKDRYVFGVRYKFNKHSKISFEYMLQEQFNRLKAKQNYNKNIFSFCYNYSF